MSNTDFEDEIKKAISKLVSQMKRDIVEFSADITTEQLKELKATIDEEIEKRGRVIE